MAAQDAPVVSFSSRSCALAHALFFVGHLDGNEKHVINWSGNWQLASAVVAGTDSQAYPSQSIRLTAFKSTMAPFTTARSLLVTTAMPARVYFGLRKLAFS